MLWPEPCCLLGPGSPTRPWGRLSPRRWGLGGGGGLDFADILGSSLRTERFPGDSGVQWKVQQKKPHVGHRGSGLASRLRQWGGAGGGAVSPAASGPEVRFQAPLLAVRWEVRKCCLPLPALPMRPHPSVPRQVRARQVRAPLYCPAGGRGT